LRVFGEDRKNFEKRESSGNKVLTRRLLKCDGREMEELELDSKRKVTRMLDFKACNLKGVFPQKNCY
jgi:hypothetical protein